MKFEKGDIIFFKPRSITSHLIAWFDGSPYSHVGVYWGEMENGNVPLFIDADYEGVNVRVLREDWGNYTVVKPYQPLTKEQIGTFAWVVIVGYGRGYDFAHLFHLFLHKATLGLYRIPYTDPQKFICSELVNYVHRVLPMGTATPASLWNYFANAKKQSYEN